MKEIKPKFPHRFSMTMINFDDRLTDFKTKDWINEGCYNDAGETQNIN